MARYYLLFGGDLEQVFMSILKILNFLYLTKTICIELY